ncbi:MAG: STAS domain-containing protein [Planctomycetota bacterium]|nr:STAS domain-containing protein [Planctomycetota bacterium]
MSTSAFVEIKQITGAAVARITCPSVGQREAPIIEEELKTAAASANNRLALDMRTVTVLGSMGLGMLVTITKRCRDGGGKLAIFGLSPALTDLVKLTKLDKFLIITRDEESAVAKITG